jgi:hypothetical protein
MATSSISSTFYPRLFRTNVSRETFFVLRFNVSTFLAQKYWRNSRAYNVGNINSRLPSIQNEEKKPKRVFVLMPSSRILWQDCSIDLH